MGWLREMRVIPNEKEGASFQGDKNVPKLDGGDGCTTL